MGARKTRKDMLHNLIFYAVITTETAKNVLSTSTIKKYGREVEKALEDYENLRKLYLILDKEHSDLLHCANRWKSENWALRDENAELKRTLEILKKLLKGKLTFHQANTYVDVDAKYVITLGETEVVLKDYNENESIRDFFGITSYSTLEKY